MQSGDNSWSGFLYSAVTISPVGAGKPLQQSESGKLITLFYSLLETEPVRGGTKGDKGAWSRGRVNRIFDMSLWRLTSSWRRLYSTSTQSKLMEALAQVYTLVLRSVSLVICPLSHITPHMSWASVQCNITLNYTKSKHIFFQVHFNVPYSLNKSNLLKLYSNHFKKYLP